VLGMRQKAQAPEFAGARPWHDRCKTSGHPNSTPSQGDRINMTSTKTKTGLAIKTSLKAGGLWANHNRTGLKVRTAIKAGSLTSNHNRTGLKVRTAIKAGGMSFNHNRALAR